MLQRLNGMFAIGLWDALGRRLFLARDRLGVKPLYYAERDGALFFASEEKGLFAAGLKPEFDPATWEELLCFRFVAGERTPFAGIKRLLPGHYLEWRRGNTQIRRWWNLGERVNTLRESSQGDAVEWLRETFDDSVKLRRISDVPVGVLLSGGLDSSCVAASLATQGSGELASFTVRFKERHYDEGRWAKAVAEKYGLKYHELVLGEEDLLDLAHRGTWLNDEPLAQANTLHLYAISKFAKACVTVLLSGEGADETFGGYVRYSPLRFIRTLKRMRPVATCMAGFPGAGHAGSLTSRLHKLGRFILMNGQDDFVLYNACDILPSDLAVLGFSPGDDFLYRRQALAEAKSVYPGEPVRQAMYLDQHTFLTSVLDRNDRATMGASVECRVPFLDYRLVEGLAALPSGVLLHGYRSKPLLRAAFGQRLPKTLLWHRKWGFGVPWQQYFQQIPCFRDCIAGLADQPPIRDGPFDRAALKRMTDGYLGGDVTQHPLLLQFFFVSVWHRACVAQKIG
jgi:asparagine synthase (glutamine-hydrolysing)